MCGTCARTPTRTHCCAREIRAGARPETAAASLLERCLAKGSTDNMSAIVVRFTGDANGPAAASTANTALRSSAPEEDEDDELTTLRADDVPQPRPPRATDNRTPAGAGRRTPVAAV